MGNDGREEHNDWKGREAVSGKHGGFRAASLVCVVEVLENMVFLSNALNFVTYFLKAMHYPSAIASNMVTNFMGTSFLLTIFGGFISDSFLGRFWTFIAFCTMELGGLILLIIQAQNKKFQPKESQTPSQAQEAILYIGLYAMAFGVGGIKATLPAHGADQVLVEDHHDHGGDSHSKHKQPLTSFFNWFFFSLCVGGLLAATFMVWIEENKGWGWSFKICAVTLSLALIIFVSGSPIYRYKRPSGSPVTQIIKVFVSATRNWRASTQVADRTERIERDGEPSQNKFKFLDKALSDSTISASQVEETRTFLGLLPIFASTIMMNCCLAQMQTFSVQQGNIMNRKIHNFTFPTPSLSVFPLIVMLSSIPIYELITHIFCDKFSKKRNLLRPLPRIGLGLALASGSMAVAAVVEVKRRQAAHNEVTLSVFWLAWQYLLLGVSDMLTLGGMLEFFYSQAPPSMRSICTALSWCSTSMGYFISSILVSLSNAVSGHFGSPWLGGSDLNHSRLDLFYTLLCVVNFLNFLNYLYWAKRY